MAYIELEKSASYMGMKVEQAQKLRKRYLTLCLEADPVTGVLHRMGVFNNDGKADWFLGTDPADLWAAFSKVFADDAGEL